MWRLQDYLQLVFICVFNQAGFIERIQRRGAIFGNTPLNPQLLSEESGASTSTKRKLFLFEAAYFQSLSASYSSVFQKVKPLWCQDIFRKETHCMHNKKYSGPVFSFDSLVGFYRGIHTCKTSPAPKIIQSAISKSPIKANKPQKI